MNPSGNAVRSEATAPVALWIRILKWVALVVFLAVPVFAFFFDRWAGRVVWTIVVASLPLFIVLVGYHRWRMICPLAFISQIPTKWRFPGTRKLQIEQNYYYIPLIIFFLSLWIRLIATNGSGTAIAIFFLLLSLSALIFGVMFTGKTWCNYICPVSFIEKIYTEPNGLRETSNSQCTKCTACKRFCPDINEENGYWKEILFSSKRVAYFTFPGLVFGFYFYYYLRRGSWDYYFGGSWTHEPQVLRTAFFPGWDHLTAGFFFWPRIPIAWAAFLTLALFGFLSFAFFALLEKVFSPKKGTVKNEKQKLRHQLFAVCGFVAFLTFYSYAGQPTLRKIATAPHFALIVVLVTATLSLARRLPRNQNDFLEETLARSILKRWVWTDTPPANLREALLIHKIRSDELSKRTHKMLDIYKDAVQETIQDGLATAEEVELLDVFRRQLGIKQADHQKVMGTLAEEQRRLFDDPLLRASPEKRLQLTSYSNALRSYLDSGDAATTADGVLLSSLRKEYRITAEEHKTVLNQILSNQKAGRFAEEVGTIERMANTVTRLKDIPDDSIQYLCSLARYRRDHNADKLLRTLTPFAPPENLSVLKSILCSEDDTAREAGIRNFLENLPASIAADLLKTFQETNLQDREQETTEDLLRARAKNTTPFIRAAALLALSRMKALEDGTLLTEAEHDENPLVLETASGLRKRLQPGSGAGLLTLEKMIALRSASIFSSLHPEDLEELARASDEMYFESGHSLCSEGEFGSEVFLLLDGKVSIAKNQEGIDQIFGYASSGDFIGELAVLDPGPRSATVIAVTEVRVLRLQGPAFYEAVHSNPSIALGVMRTLVERIRDTGERPPGQRRI